MILRRTIYKEPDKQPDPCDSYGKPIAVGDMVAYNCSGVVLRGEIERIDMFEYKKSRDGTRWELRVKIIVDGSKISTRYSLMKI